MIVGAGLSGIGAAHHLQDRLPGRSYAILEAREAIGGTWDLFRYPGVRSDSDMQTLGYRFKPWTRREGDRGRPVDPRVRARDRARGGHRRARALRAPGRAARAWADGRWTLDDRRTRAAVSARSCTCAAATTATTRATRRRSPAPSPSRGEIIHPQFWPEDFDYTGKRVVVIGSGATAVTLVPAMTDKAAHVTMLQRSPTLHPLAAVARQARATAAQAARRPARLRGHALEERRGLDARLPGLAALPAADAQADPQGRRSRGCPAGFDVDLHFNPTYGPWDQRLCLVPDGDLFRAICATARRRSSPTASSASRRTGIQLASGEHLDADVIVTATGLNLQAFGGIDAGRRRRAGRTCPTTSPTRA